MARLRGAAAQSEFTSCVGLEIAAQEALYPWQTARENLGFTLETLTSGTLEEIPTKTICQKLTAYLDKTRPDVVAICGYERVEMRAALNWCNKNKKIAVLMSESKRDDAPRRAWKEAIKKRIVRRFDAGLVGGAAHKRYLRELGIAENRIFDGYDVVDNAAFAALADKWREQGRRVSRPYFLTVNRFIERKNLARVIEAWRDYRKNAVRNFPDASRVGFGVVRRGRRRGKSAQTSRANGIGRCSFHRIRAARRSRALDGGRGRLRSRGVAGAVGFGRQRGDGVWAADFVVANGRLRAGIVGIESQRLELRPNTSRRIKRAHELSGARNFPRTPRRVGRGLARDCRGVAASAVRRGFGEMRTRGARRSGLVRGET